MTPPPAVASIAHAGQGMPESNAVPAGASGGPQVGRAGATPERLDDWELVAPVAQGEYATVYRARPAGAAAARGAAYAVKRLATRWESQPAVVAMFQRQAVVGRAVHHPRLVSILAAHVQAPPYYVVMPWLEGRTLDRIRPLGPRGPLPLWLALARQVAEALAALDAAGWLHGDLKPANVLVSPDGRATLLDLGFCRRADEVGSQACRLVTGTPHYLAPETLTSALRTDIRSDLYSLGVLLYGLLAGRPPFRAGTLAELVRLHRAAEPTPLTAVSPWVPEDVARLVHRLLAKEPLRRPATPREVVDALAALEVAYFADWGTVAAAP